MVKRLLFFLLLILGLCQQTLAQCSGIGLSLGPNSYWCTNGTANLTGTLSGTTLTPSSYTWFANGTQVSTSSSLTVTTTGTYILQIQLPNGCSVSDTLVIANLSVSGGVIAGNQLVCNNGDPAAFTVVTAASVSPAGASSISYQWQSAPTASGPWTTISGATGSTYNPGPISATTFYRRVAIVGTGATACTDYSNTLEVTAFTANLSVSSNQCVAIGSGVNLSSILVPTPSNYTPIYSWLGPNNYNSSSQTPSFANFSAAMAGTYVASASIPGSINGNGGTCIFTASTVLNAIPQPPSFSLPATGCPQTAYVPSFTAQAGVSYTWTVSPSTGATITGASTATPSFSFATGGNYTVSVSANSNGCITPGVSQTINIMALTLEEPYVSVNSNYISSQLNNGLTTFAICAGASTSTALIENASLQNATNPLGTTYSIAFGTGSPQVFNDSLLQSISYGNNYMTLTASSGACTLIDTINIYSGSNPFVSLGSSNTVGICPGNPITFLLDPTLNANSSNPPGTTYTITFSDDPSFSQVFTDITQDQLINYVFDSTSCGQPANGVNFPANTFYAQVIAQNACGQTVSSVSPITVNDNPDPEFSLTDSTICVGQSVTATNTGTSGSVVGSTSPYNCTSQGKFYWTITGVSPSGAILTAPTAWTLAPGSVLGAYNSNYNNMNVSATNNGSNSITATFLQAGYYTIVQHYYNTCGTETFTRHICVIEAPVCSFSISPSPGCSPLVTTTNNTSVAPTCSGTPVDLAYQWSVTNPAGTASTISSATAVAPTITFTNTTNQPQTFTVSMTVSPMENGGAAPWSTPNCSSTCTHTVVVYPELVITSPPTATVCNAAALSIPLTANVASTFTWQATDNPNVTGESTTIQNTSTITDLLVNTSTVIQTVTYTVIGSSMLGACPDTLVLTVTLIPPITMSDPPDVTICAGALQPSIAFSASLSPATFSWTNSNSSIGLSVSGVGPTPAFNGSNTGAVPISGTITVTPTSNGCTGTPQQFTITVNPLPTVSSISNQTSCAGSLTSAVVFSSSIGSSSFTWSNSNPSIGLAASGSGDIAAFTGVNSSNTTQVATIQVSASNAGCVGPPLSFTISIVPGPSVNLPNNQISCAGSLTQLIQFSGSQPGNTYSWSNSNTSIGLPASGTGDIAAFSTINSGNTPQVATITVSPSSQGCPGTSQQFTITVQPIPQVSPLSNLSYCQGTSTGTVSFTSATNVANTTYDWTNSNPGIGLAASGNGSGIASFVASNTSNAVQSATITVVPIAASCSGPATSFTIQVTPTPQVVALPDQTLCNGSPSTALNFTTSVSGTTIDWTNTNTTIGLAASGSGSIAVFNAVNSTSTTQVSTLSITPSLNGCTGPTDQLVISVLPTATVASQADLTVCHGQQVAQNSPVLNPSNANLSWSIAAPAIGLNPTSGVGAVPSFQAQNSSSSPQSAVLTLTPSISLNAVSCPGTPLSYTVTVNPIPTIAAISNQAYCSGDNTTIVVPVSNPATASFTWTNSNPTIGLAAAGTGTIPSFTTVNSGNTPASALISILPSYTNNGISCQGSVLNFSFSVNPIPVVDAINDATICAGNTLSMSFTSTPTLSGVVYNWSNSNTAIGLGPVGTGAISFLSLNSGFIDVTSTLTVTPTFTNAGATCTGTAQSALITVHPSPLMSALTNQTICAGTTTSAVTFASNVAATSYSWTNSNATIGLAANGNGTIAPFLALNTSNAAATATITVSPTATFGTQTCTGLPQTMTFTVNPIPQLSPIAAQSICAGTAVSVIPVSSISTGMTYSWTNTNPAIGLPAAGTTAILFSAQNTSNSAIVGQLSLTPTATSNGLSCVGSPISTQIEVLPTPQLTPLIDQVYCPNELSIASSFSSTVSGSTYSWINSNGAIGLGTSGNGNIPSFTTVNTSNTVVATAQIQVTPTYTSSAQTCVGLPSVFTITVNPSPIVNPMPALTYCTGSTTNPIAFTGTATSYQWASSSIGIGIGAAGLNTLPSFLTINTGSTSLSSLVTVTPQFTNLGVSCAGSPTTFEITVQAVPTVNDPIDQVLCNGSTTQTVVFNGTVASTTYNWINSNPSIGIAASGSGTISATTVSNIGSNPALAQITITPSTTSNSVTCFGPTQDFTITVNPSPLVQFSMANQTICSGSATQALTISSPTAGASITWTAASVSSSLTGLTSTTGNASIPSFTITNSSSTAQSITLNASATTAGTVACPGGGSSYTITVNPTPTVQDPPDQLLCANTATQAINLIGTGTSYSWTNSNSSCGLAGSGLGSITSFTAINTSNQATQATLVITPIFSLNGVNCPGSTQDLSITINPIPQVGNMLNQTYCPGQQSTLTPITGTGTSYDWTNSNPAIGLMASGSGSIPSFTTVNNGSAQAAATLSITPTFTYQGLACQGPISTYQIVINPSPTLAPLTGQVLCSNVSSTVVNYVSNATNFSWSNADPSIGLAAQGSGSIPAFTTQNTSTSNVLTSTVQVTPIYTANAVSCPGPVQAMTFSVLPIPTVQALSNQTLCNGAQTQAISWLGTGTAYTWTNTLPSIGLAASGQGDIAAFTAQNLTPSQLVSTIQVLPVYSYLSTSCNGNPSSLTITVNPTPFVLDPTDQVICNGSTSASVNFSGNGTSYSWTNDQPGIGIAASGSGTIGSFIASNQGLTPLVATINVMPTYSGGNSSCPGQGQSFTITVNPTPTINALADQELCSGSTTQAISFTGNASSFQWVNSAPSVGLAASGMGSIVPFIANNPSTSTPLIATIQATPIFSNAGLSCTGIPISIQLTVDPLPVVTGLSNLAVCNGAVVPSLPISGTGTNYNWTNATPLNGLAASGSGLNIPSFVAANPGVAPLNSSISVTPIYTSAQLTCTGTTQGFTLAVLPTPTVNPLPDQLFCNGDLSNPLSFTGAVTSTVFNWTNALPSIGLAATGSGPIAPFTVQNSTSAQVQAQLQVIPTLTLNGTTCAGIASSFLFQINPTPQVSNPGNQVYCANVATNSLVFAGTATSYQWQAGSTNIGINPSGLNSVPSFTTVNTGLIPLNTQVNVTPYFSQGGLNCPGPMQSFVFSVNPTPSANPIPNQDYCHLEQAPALTISGTGTSYNWSNSLPSIGLSAVGFNSVPAFTANNPSIVTNAAPVVATVSVVPAFSANNLTCLGDTITYQITVNPLPHVQQLNDTILCNHGQLNVNLASNIPSNVAWSSTFNAQISGASIVNQTAPYIGDSLSNLSNQPQFLTYTISPIAFPSGCAGPDSSFVVQIQPDVQLVIPTNLEICSGAPVNALLNANVPSTFTWEVSLDNPNVSGESFVSNTGNLINDVLINTTSVNQLVVYTIYPTSVQGACSGAIQTLTVLVKPPLQLLNEDTLTICSGTALNLQLVANTNVGFNWYADQSPSVTGESLSVVSSSLINDVLVNTSTTVQLVHYHVVGTAITNGCSSPVFDVIAYVNPVPIVNAINDTTLCAQSIVTPIPFSGSVFGTVYHWTASPNAIGLSPLSGTNALPGFLATNTAVVPINAAIQVQGIFTNNGVSCSSSFEPFQVVVNPVPNVFPLTDSPYCAGETAATVTVTGAIPGTTFTWSNSSTAVGLAATGQGDIPAFVTTNPGIATIQSEVYVTPYYLNNAIACQGQTESYTITVYPMPHLTTSPVAICSGSATNLALSATITSNFEWHADPTATVYGETAAPIQNSALINDVLIQNTLLPQVVTYHVVPISIPNGCIGPDSLLNVTVNPLPQVAFSTTNTALCDLSPVNFQNNSLGILDFMWDFGDNTSSILNNPSHIYASAGNYTVGLIGIDPLTGCMNSVSQPLTISASPDPSFTYSDSVGCGILDVVFNAASANTSWDYQWTFGNGDTTNQVGSTGYQFTVPGCYDIALTVTTNFGCSANYAYPNAVCLYEEAVADFSVSDYVLSSLEPIVNFYNHSQHAVSYSWDFGDGTSGLAENPIHVYPPDPASYLVTLTAYNEVGCIDTATATIVIFEDFSLYVPNSFTPNNDENNQYFQPIVAGGFKRDSYHLMIFNRWGELVFESYDPDYGWDGTYGFENEPYNQNWIKGMTCQDGTYTWKISLEILQSQEVRHFTGHVNLLR
ncbi:MAG: hypothetical protein RLZZ301_64 [Bacteroidota bacterium]|jgi:gliding motility-associated-like protein